MSSMKEVAGCAGCHHAIATVSDSQLKQGQNLGKPVKKEQNWDPVSSAFNMEELRLPFPVKQ